MRRAGLLACLLAALVPTPAARADTTVDYQGLRITVPAGWPVYRLDPRSTECVRFDRHALYLGTAGTNQLCPAHVIGRTEALHVEPLTEQTAAFATGMLGSSPPSSVAGVPAVTVTDTTDGEIRSAVPGAGVLITGSYGAGPGAGELRRLIAGIAQERSDAGQRRSGDRRRRWVTGAGFDTCSAPSLAAMRAWHDDFVAANIYIGGPARACPDGRLSRRWVEAVQAMGWRLIPTYVGPQAPCTSSRPRFSPSTAALAGQLSAVDATNRAAALGLPPGTPIYMDLEAYGRRAWCRQAVLTFVDSWTRGVRALEYVPGLYSSVASGVRDVAEADDISRPETVWFAHWDRRPNVWGDRLMGEDWWADHRRIKQFRGDHVEKHGGVKLKIDSDAVDGYVG
ncbi:glycoside hydrolase domain-containing protein [Actinoallomurus acaciae]|uniref:Glycoside hydrolase domain-containing protein n=1 Tax=Actinoallomurus acaciae TaxID=502577 RepID=A0ABV5YTT4_9ACTN